MPPPDVEKLVGRVRQVASLPQIHFKLKHIVESSEANARTIGRLVAEDAGLTVRILRIVNSALYGFSRKIETVSQAVAFIGLQQLLDLALTTSITQFFFEASRKTQYHRCKS